MFMGICVVPFLWAVSCAVACADMGVPIASESANAKPNPLAIERDKENISHPK